MEIHLFQRSALLLLPLALLLLNDVAVVHAVRTIDRPRESNDDNFHTPEKLKVDAAALAEEAVGGDRGTGLSPGEWKIGGGAYKAFFNVDPSFKMFFKVHSITDDALVATVHSSSTALGEHFKQEYTNLNLPFSTIGWGLFGSKKGYLYSGNLCTVSNNCASGLFIEQNQNKGRAKVMGVWMETGNAASQVSAAAALAEEAAGALAEEAVGGDRGTGLSTGEWKIGGGAYKAFFQVDSSFKMFFKVHSITDDALVATIHSSSMALGRHFKQEYTNLNMPFSTIGWGLFGSKKGYLYSGDLCTVVNNCANAIFIEQNQNKGRAKVMGVWMETGGGATTV